MSTPTFIGERYDLRIAANVAPSAGGATLRYAITNLERRPVYFQDQFQNAHAWEPTPRLDVSRYFTIRTSELLLFPGLPMASQTDETKLRPSLAIAVPDALLSSFGWWKSHLDPTQLTRSVGPCFFAPAPGIYTHSFTPIAPSATLERQVELSVPIRESGEVYDDAPWLLEAGLASAVRLRLYFTDTAGPTKEYPEIHLGSVDSVCDVPVAIERPLPVQFYVDRRLSSPFQYFPRRMTNPVEIAEEAAWAAHYTLWRMGYELPGWPPNPPRLPLYAGDGEFVRYGPGRDTIL